MKKSTIGILLGIIGIISTYYIYQEQKENTEKQVVIDTIRFNRIITILEDNNNRIKSDKLKNSEYKKILEEINIAIDKLEKLNELNPKEIEYVNTLISDYNNEITKKWVDKKISNETYENFREIYERKSSTFSFNNENREESLKHNWSNKNGQPSKNGNTEKGFSFKKDSSNTKRKLNHNWK